MKSRKEDYSLSASWHVCSDTYIIALIAALAAGYAVKSLHPIAVAFIADTVATIVVFIFSYLYDNSSLYDPYWSVVPPVIGIYYIWPLFESGALSLWQVMALACVFIWGVRLTLNWLRHWTGLMHEDWRYVDIRNKTGRAYWPASFMGIHYFPTIQVFLGCLSLYPVLSQQNSFNPVLATVAAIVTLGATWIEATADRQLLNFAGSGPEPGSIMNSGLWKWSRHPNYFGEVSFWWGLFLFSLSTGTFYWYALIGPVAITVMFIVVSVPLLDTRMLGRRPGYKEHMQRTRMLIPLPRIRKVN